MHYKNIEKGLIGVYKITSPSNKVYIGQSKCIRTRWLYYNSLNCKGQSRLYHSFKKYGVENHKFEVLCICGINEVDEIEQYYQLLFNSISQDYGLNCNIVNLKRKYNKPKKNVKHHHSEVKVIDTSNGVIYDSIKKCAEELKINRSTLNSYLSGRKKNKTSLKYLDNDNFKIKSYINIVAINKESKEVVKGDLLFMTKRFKVHRDTISRYINENKEIRNKENSNWVFKYDCKK